MLEQEVAQGAKRCAQADDESCSSYLLSYGSLERDLRELTKSPPPKLQTPGRLGCDAGAQGISAAVPRRPFATAWLASRFSLSLSWGHWLRWVCHSCATHPFVPKGWSVGGGGQKSMATWCVGSLFPLKTNPERKHLRKRRLRYPPIAKGADCQSPVAPVFRLLGVLFRVSLPLAWRAWKVREAAFRNIFQASVRFHVSGGPKPQQNASREDVSVNPQTLEPGIYGSFLESRPT